MKILVVGGGGREHAIIKKLIDDQPEDSIMALPGNGGIAADCECIPADPGRPGEILEIARKRGIEMTIVGPEVPLSSGISDIFLKAGMKIFGPVKRAAMLESSKAFAKDFMCRHGIPTADYQDAYTLEEGVRHLERRQMPCVIKFDGLAAGKGVRIVENVQEGIGFLRDIFVNDIFRAESKKVIIEDCLSGAETSYLVFTDTRNFIPMVPARDYKKAYDGNKGPNTGGMGSYSPPSDFDKATEEIILEKIVRPTIRGLQKDNIDYRGVLYFGIMLTGDGPQMLEYNVRFGDPETQVILPRMKTPLLEVIGKTAAGELGGLEIEWSEDRCICVILASGGYPGPYRKGEEITGIEEAGGVLLFHAGTEKSGGKLLTSGGRVMGITALDRSLSEARKRAYRAAEAISFTGKHYRRDIAVE